MKYNEITDPKIVEVLDEFRTYLGSYDEETKSYYKDTNDWVNYELLLEVITQRYLACFRISEYKVAWHKIIEEDEELVTENPFMKNGYKWMRIIYGE